MSGQTWATRSGDDIRAPRSTEIGVFTVTTAQVIDLAASGGPQVLSDQFAQNLGGGGGVRSEANSSFGSGTVAFPAAPLAGWVGHWVDIFADGGDIGLITGPTSASVSGGNAPVLATTGNAGTAGVCMRIPNGTYRPYLITADDRFLGVVSAGTTTLRIAKSSR
jgi:hypothetical protein